MYNMQRGRGRWRSGADTCVFSPPVKCADETTRRDPNQYVSRIVSKNSSDVQIEEILRTRFPGLLDYRLIAISEKACIPKYDTDDVRQNDDYIERGNGCKNLRIKGDRINDLNSKPEHVNLITPKLVVNVSDFIHTTGLEKDTLKKINGITHALIASILLVPDRGPWVVHQDLHFGNILIAQATEDATINHTIGENTKIQEIIKIQNYYSTIADWGRVMYIENDFRQPIVNWANMFVISQEEIQKKTILPPNIVYDRIKKVGMMNLPQHPSPLMNLLAEAYREAASGEAITPKSINAIRSSMAYVILYQCLLGGYTHKDLVDYQPLTAVLDSSSQFDLIQKINDVVYKEFGYTLFKQNRQYPQVWQVYTTTCQNILEEGIPVLGDMAKAVVKTRGANTTVFAKQDIVCRVKTQGGLFVKIALPEKLELRQEIRRRFTNPRNLNDFIRESQVGSVYTWILGRKQESEPFLIFSHVHSALEVATAHLTLATHPAVDMKVIYGAGEVRKLQDKYQFNFLSGTYTLQLFNKEAECIIAMTYELEDVIRKMFGNQIQIEFSYSTQPQDTFITTDLPLDDRLIEEYRNTGIKVNVYPSQEACMNDRDEQMTGGSISSSRRLPSVPKRKDLRSSSSSKKRYTRRRRALRSGRGGYRPRVTGRKV